MSIEPFFELVNGLALMLGALLVLILLLTVFLPLLGYFAGILIGQYLEWGNSARQGLGIVLGISFMPLWLRINKFNDKNTES